MCVTDFLRLNDETIVVIPETTLLYGSFHGGREDIRQDDVLFKICSNKERSAIPNHRDNFVRWILQTSVDTSWNSASMGPLF